MLKPIRTSTSLKRPERYRIFGASVRSVPSMTGLKPIPRLAIISFDDFLLRKFIISVSVWTSVPPVNINKTELGGVRQFKSQQLQSWDFVESASGLARLGSQTIFLLLNDLSHDSHLKKKIKFSSSQVLLILDSEHGSPKNYSDFLVCFTSSRLRAMWFS